MNAIDAEIDRRQPDGLTDLPSCPESLAGFNATGKETPPVTLGSRGCDLWFSVLRPTPRSAVRNASWERLSDAAGLVSATDYPDHIAASCHRRLHHQTQREQAF